MNKKELAEQILKDKIATLEDADQLLSRFEEWKTYEFAKAVIAAIIEALSIQGNAQIIINGQVIETKNITGIHDIERDKRMFLNREAGFVITFMDGSQKVFKENIPYESTPNDIAYKKEKWANLQKEVTDKWELTKNESAPSMKVEAMGKPEDDIMGATEPWPLPDVLNKLIEASEILLHRKNYDGHGWEEIRHAVNRAKQIVSLLCEKQVQPEAETEQKFHAVDYSGFWSIQTSPYYEEKVDILNAEAVGEKEACEYANLIVKLLNEHYAKRD